MMQSNAPSKIHELPRISGPGNWGTQNTCRNGAKSSTIYMMDHGQDREHVSCADEHRAWVAVRLIQHDRGSAAEGAGRQTKNRFLVSYHA